MVFSQALMLQILKKHQLLATILLFVGILLCGCINNSDTDESVVAQNDSTISETELTVSATIFPIYDILRQIAGETVTTELILQPGESPHTFNMTPSVQKIIDNSNLIFVVGHGLDNWIVKSGNVSPVHTNVSLLTSNDDDDKHHDGVNPHYWLTPGNASIIATNIATVLAELDPINAESYEARAANFHAAMISLESELLGQVGPIKTIAFITLHDSFSYLAQAFGLNLVGSFEPSGAEEPSPRYLKKLHETVESHNVKAVFSEPQLSVGGLTAFINDSNLKLDVLDPIGGIEERQSYQTLLKYNIRKLTSTLAK